MARALIISLFAVLCLVCISEVLSEDCAPYVDSNARIVSTQQCIVLTSCGGTCTNRYCIIGGNLNQSEFMCIITNLYFIIGMGVLFSLLMVCGIIASCWKCCLVASIANCK
ncbi:hypothetical protein GDO81_018173 [Engystomops pustulosus]|uniref:Shisa N-terminal domain-containing protein n=1 Tax=Engystomops pustulosus TaxID=76066 RepID=A0AAV7A7G4_ENGPU|nr:hypothetical protein GDO81_018173 [Engystomops pustulosus]